MSRSRHKHAVLLCLVSSADFHPETPWQIPRRTLGTELVANGLGLCDACHLVSVHNLEVLRSGLPIETWLTIARRGHVDRLVPDDVLISQEMPPAAVLTAGNGEHRGPGAIAGQGGAVLPPLPADLEVTPAALLTEDCS